MNSNISSSIGTNALGAQEGLSSLRKTSVIAGALYLLTFVSIPTLVLYDAIHRANYILSPGPEISVIVGVVTEMIVALAGIGTAVVLYPVLKKQNEGTALALVSSRILEAGTIFAGVMFLLTIVSLRQSDAGVEALIVSRTLITMYDRMFLIGQSFMPAVNDLLLGFLLYKSRLVPRGLSLIGIIGGPVLIAGDSFVLSGLIGQHSPLTSVFAIPVALFEFSFGIWLLVRGFNDTPAAIVPIHNLFKLAASVKPTERTSINYEATTDSSW